MRRHTGRRKILVATVGLATVAYVTLANRGAPGAAEKTSQADAGASGAPEEGGGGVAPEASSAVPVPDPREHVTGNLPAPPPVPRNGGCNCDF